MTRAQRRNLSRAVLAVLNVAYPIQPLFVGHPTTGVPIQLSMATFEHIKSLLEADVSAGTVDNPLRS